MPGTNFSSVKFFTNLQIKTRFFHCSGQGWGQSSVGHAIDGTKRDKLEDFLKISLQRKFVEVKPFFI